MNKILEPADQVQIEQDIFDAHFHIIDSQFPIISNQNYTPVSFTLETYRQTIMPLGIVSGALISGSFNGFDQSYLRTLLPILGPQWVGVTQVPLDVSDQTIIDLKNIGVRAFRFNAYRGFIHHIDDMVCFAMRAYALGQWHMEIYADTAVFMPHVEKLSKLPKIVIDHLGMSEKGLPVLLDLVDAGAYVKATGFGRVDMNVPIVLEKIAASNPNALIFGTDLPSTRAKRPFSRTDIELIKQVLGPVLARKALWSNARSLYQLSK